MKISDRFFAGPEENTVMAFLHRDLGKDFTDHHTVALIGLPDAPPGIDHAAFAVLDLDDLMIGHEYLRARLSAQLGHRAARRRQSAIRLLA
jgi:hypothetical protein